MSAKEMFKIDGYVFNEFKEHDNKYIEYSKEDEEQITSIRFDLEFQLMTIRAYSKKSEIFIPTPITIYEQKAIQQQYKEFRWLDAKD